MSSGKLLWSSIGYARTFTGITMDLGMTLLVYNLMKTLLTRPRPGRVTSAPAMAGD